MRRTLAALALAGILPLAGCSKIAGIWHHVVQANYDARPEHEARDG